MYGTHTIAVRKPGFLDAMITVQLAIGQSFSFSPTLKQMGNADSIKPAGRLKKVFGRAPRDMAAVQIKTRPKGARVTVNDRALHKPAPMEFLLQPGNYEIAIMLEGYKPVHRVISLREGTNTVIDEALDKE
jgi:PEGA domain-containing protein